MAMRSLSVNEKNIARSVFRNSIPYNRVTIEDNLGPLPRMSYPYANTRLTLIVLHLGPDIYRDATLKINYKGFGRYDEIFIHELAHAWQYDKGYFVALNSIWANTLGSGYKYKVGKAWDDYNVEQQADIVSDWYVRGMSLNDPRFVYIDKIIRPNVGMWSLIDLMKVRLPADKLKKIK